MNATSTIEGRIERPRLDDEFRRAALRAVTIVTASSGAGTSTAIGAYLRKLGGPKAHHVPPAHVAGLVPFVHGFAEELRDLIPALTHGFGVAAASAARRARPASALAEWFVDHLGARPITLALDDLDFLEGRDDINEFIVRAVERSAEEVRWILGLRSTAGFPIGKWLAAKKADVRLGEQTLRFSEAEAVELARVLGVDRGRALDAYQRSFGHAGRLNLGLLDENSLQDAECGFEKLLEPFATRLLGGFSSDRLRAFHALLSLPYLAEPMLRRIPFAEEVAATIERRATFALAPSLRRRMTRSFATVAARVSPACENVRVEAMGLAVHALEDSGAIATALRVALSGTSTALSLSLLERHGFTLAESGCTDLIADAVRTLTPEEGSKNSVALALEAMRESDLGRHDVADSWFAHAIENAPTALARAKIQYVYAGNLLRRGRFDCIEIFEAIVAQDTTPELNASATAALGAAYGTSGRWDEAHRCIDLAMQRVHEIGDISTRASVYQSAAYVALQAHDVEAAERYAGVALSLGDEHGYDRIVVLALIVRYVVAISYKDDIATALTVLKSLEAYATRLGNAYFRRYALLAQLEAHAERGDGRRFELLERALAREELENDVQHAEESLLPSRAMQLAWTEDFVGAYRLLASSAEHHANYEQRALRWSEIAIYAAAGRLDDTASGAIAAARKAMKKVAFSGGATFARARLNLALATLLLGRFHSSSILLASAAHAVAALPRLRAFHEVIEAMLDRRRGTANHERILQLLEAMNELGFGGIGRIIEALPEPCTSTVKVAS